MSYFEIGWELVLIPNTLQGIHSKDNRKASMGQFAKEMGIDPLVADDWHTISKGQFKNNEVCVPPLHDSSLVFFRFS